MSEAFPCSAVPVSFLATTAFCIFCSLSHLAPSAFISSIFSYTVFAFCLLRVVLNSHCCPISSCTSQKPTVWKHCIRQGVQDLRENILTSSHQRTKPLAEIQLSDLKQIDCVFLCDCEHLSMTLVFIFFFKSWPLWKDRRLIIQFNHLVHISFVILIILSALIIFSPERSFLILLLLKLK